MGAGKNSENLLIIFYRNPELGKVKTRLAATVGEEKALAIYLKLCAHTRESAKEAAADKVVFYSNWVDSEDMWDNASFHKERQQGNDLGERMHDAFTKAFKKKYRSVCIIGTDCPGLTTELIDEAFIELKTSEAVIGPSTDGGYYLLGMKELHAAVFRNKKWSTTTVLADTVKDLERSAIRYHQLLLLTDVDEGRDLRGINLPAIGE